MGTDIHLHTEVKIDGKWHHYSAPNFGRNYCIFEKMAGVRGCMNKAISPPKGLPDDISLITYIDSRDSGGHSHSWLGSEEIKQLSRWIREQNWTWPYNDLEYQWSGYCFGSEWGYAHKYVDFNLQDVRFVFWFDS